MSPSPDQSSFLGSLRKALRAPGTRYELLRQALDRALENGVLKPGEFLPSERDLAAELEVSRSTLRKAFAPLLESGQLEQKVGAGTFVSKGSESKLHKALNQLNSFSEDIRARGMTPSSKWLRRELVPADPQVAIALAATPGHLVSLFERVRFANEEPMAYEQSYFPKSVLDAQDLGEFDSLYNALDSVNRRPARALQSFQATASTPQQAEFLNISAGDPVLTIERRGFGNHGEPVEFTRSLYRGDRYVFALEMGG